MKTRAHKNELARKWRKTNPKSCAASQRKWRSKNPDRVAAYGRRHHYGITEQQFLALLAVQHNKCAICGNKITRSAHTDHNHATGKIRGLLCNLCNCGLGFFRERPQLLHKASIYLENNQ